ncbi:ABC transporter ATP-binding protein [Desulfotalea psychrophila]|uniref:Related to ABC transporter, ATP-binding protein n=1 Tax=Desulfotalea psychrophila (strain LSv54 / DSM 12343) TaxID=177439 RepID=Q6AKV9_DESPS|nr:ABC transporter ATP-binding protein [Desulfotalea psychrophila]CAG37016.1 related to ABC transporter, ATP-binding protein [Desulfotalea psychrophila LSv54]
MAEPLIEFIDVEKSFGDNHVLRGVSLSIYRGEITVIIGKSGCGKSVLLKHIIGLMQQDSGLIKFEGKCTDDMTRSEQRTFRKKFSYMFQDNALFDSLTIFQNIALPLSEKGLFSKESIAGKVNEIMTTLEIEQTASSYPAELSGGMKKRVALARALITKPEIILFDEPTTGLDPVRKNKVHQMIRDYKDVFGFTGVVVSHEIPDIFEISQRIVMIDQGKTVIEGTLDELVQFDSDLVKSFIQGHKLR